MSDHVLSDCGRYGETWNQRIQRIFRLYLFYRVKYIDTRGGNFKPVFFQQLGNDIRDIRLCRSKTELFQAVMNPRQMLIQMQSTLPVVEDGLEKTSAPAKMGIVWRHGHSGIQILAFVKKHGSPLSFVRPLNPVPAP